MDMKSVVREEDAEDKVQVEDESLWRPLEGTAQRRRRYDLVHQCLKLELCFPTVMRSLQKCIKISNVQYTETHPAPPTNKIVCQDAGPIMTERV